MNKVRKFKHTEATVNLRKHKILVIESLLSRVSFHCDKQDFRQQLISVPIDFFYMTQGPYFLPYDRYPQCIRCVSTWVSVSCSVLATCVFN